MKIFEDKGGKLSSKRIFGASLLGIGLIFAIILFTYSIKGGAKDPATAISIINMFLLTGAGILGVGIFEGIKK